MSDNLAVVALEAASRIHNRVAAGGGVSVSQYGTPTHGKVEVTQSDATAVLRDASQFLNWLKNNSPKEES